MQTKFIKQSVEILVVAMIYIVTAKIGQLFAIPPGNITPVWLPSGIVLALILIRGTYLWPAVFIGAFFGNASAYIDFSSTTSIMSAITSGTFNGIGDVISALLPVYVMKRYLGSVNIFKRLKHYWFFLWSAVIAGPFISAVFGVTSLAWMGFLEWPDYYTSFITWWVGDAVGVLILAPTILIYKYENRDYNRQINHTEMISFLVTVVGLSYLIIKASFEVIFLPPANYFMIPLLFWALTRLNQKTVYLTILAYMAVTVYSTSLNIGPFSAESQLIALLQMQGFMILLTISVFIVSTLLNERNVLLSQLEDKVSHDLLTNAKSRLYFEEQLKQEIHRFDRQEIPFSLIMFDIDNFKEVNDSYGHLTGDEILKAIVKEVSKNLRQTDTLARWGGEEFMLLLPGANVHGAHSYAETVRKRIEQKKFLEQVHITISLSIHEYQVGQTYNKFLAELDHGLYQSKSQGRNRTTVVTPKKK